MNFFVLDVLERDSLLQFLLIEEAFFLFILHALAGLFEFISLRLFLIGVVHLLFLKPSGHPASTDDREMGQFHSVMVPLRLQLGLASCFRLSAVVDDKEGTKVLLAGWVKIHAIKL